VMTNLFGKEDRHREVNRVMDDAIAKMQSLGAIVTRFELPDYDALASNIDTSTLEGHTVMDRYFASLPASAPIKTFADLVIANTSAVQDTLEIELQIPNGMGSDLYKTRMLNRERLRMAVAKKMADLNLDAILYPHQRILVVPVGAKDQAERNGTLSN